MDLMVDLVSDQTGLRYKVGLHSLVDGGSGDSSHGRGVVDNGGNNWGNSDSWGSVDSSYRGSVGGNSCDTMAGIAETMSKETSTVSSVTQTMSKETNTVSCITQTMSGKANHSGIRISGWSSNSAAKDGGKYNKGVHLAV